MPADGQQSTYDQARMITRAVLAGDDFTHLTGISLDPDLPVSKKPVQDPNLVGIWRRVTKQTERYAFIRSDKCAGEWHLWADVEGIPPKGHRRRIVLIGESTARGYFYDPEFTPANVLESMLQTAQIPSGVEVIDLARSDLSVEGELPRLFQSCARLEPDLIIVFAGNNRILPYNILTGSTQQKKILASILKDQGVAGISELSAAWRRTEIQKVVESLTSSACPVLYVIPEFNLGDWYCEPSGDAPWFNQDENKRWYALLQQVREAQRSGDSERVEQLALQMIAIDKGTASQGAQILANCYRHRDCAKAREFAVQARDAHIGWDFGSPETPRLDQVSKDALIACLAKSGINFIDCASLYADYLDHDLPDRRLFLDYCHLTEQGINLTMAATASKALDLLAGTQVSTHTLLKSVPFKASRKVSAQAHFAAAIHNAHWGQPVELISHHIESALQYHPEMQDLCECYLDIISSKTPNWTHKNMQQILSSPYGSLVKYIVGYGTVSLLDTVLGEALATALESCKPGVFSNWKRLRQQQYGLTADRAEDLLHPCYAPTYMDREWAHSGAAGAIQSNHPPVIQFMAHSPESSFCWICKGDTTVILDLTCRAQDIDTGNNQSILQAHVNGHMVAEIRLDDTWKCAEIEVPAALLIDGLNKLVLHWPTALIPAEIALARIARKTEERIGAARFSPIYGRIHSLKARLAVEPNGNI